MSFRSPYPDVDIPTVSLTDFLFGGLSANDLDRTAVVDGVSGARTTYGELISQIDGIAGALAARGIGIGSVVGLLSPNTPRFVSSFHGILRSGATATTINALYTAADIAKQLTGSGACALFTVSALLPQAVEGARSAGLAADRVFVLDSADGYTSFDDLLAEHNPVPEVTFDPDTHLAVLPYSSGTTGHPKGVMLSHRNLVANVCQLDLLLGVSSADRVLAVLPLFHIYGMTVLLNSALRNRATLVTLPKFELTHFLTAISEQRCTYVFIAPPVAIALAKHPVVDEYDLSSVRTIMSGAAPLDRQLAVAVEQRLGCQVKQGFGMSEMSPVSHVIPFDRTDIPLDSVGPTLPNIECKLVDPTTGTEVEYPVGEGLSDPGELWCKGPNIMLGYLDNTAATADTLDTEGFLHTGDIATVDAAGNVFIVDRLKELIKYKGYQVPPAELEAVLLSHPQISDAAVIGVPDDQGEEVPKAFVVRQPSGDLDESDVIEYVAARVSPHKKVRQVEFIDIVPKSAAGKILRKELRSLG
ncbi:AMP-binding protein [Rhodococcus sp. CSLK01-03]|uniref:AMP-binding protein n=1 Tax=Rhodococcus indonesiensis TaxID=3055869 RepID=A0ABT7RNY3_9NOCA|nr:AMP-binding protein [Rhodococcus indonesiensis]MDM7489348.1 AMP-binding protein [Rhodococcus indonesiensis]